MKKNYLRHIILLGIAATVLTACEYKDLDEPYDGNKKRHLIVNFNWANIDSIPGSMRIVFYPEEPGQYSQGYTFYDISNRRDTIEVPVSTYNVSAWNNDIEHVIIDGYGRHTSTFATTGNYSPHGNTNIPKVLDSLYQNMRVLDYPDYMVHANTMDFRINEDYDYQELIMKPDSMVVTMEVKIKKIKGLEHCQKIRGAIENIPSKRYIGYPNRTEEPAVVMFDAEPQMEDSCVTAKFWVFGIEPTDIASLKHRMTLFFWITGAQVFTTLNVTQCFRQYGVNDAYVLIEPEEIDLDLSKYIKQGQSGFEVDAEDWQETNIDLSF